MFAYIYNSIIVFTIQNILPFFQQTMKTIAIKNNQNTLQARNIACRSTSYTLPYRDGGHSFRKHKKGTPYNRRAPLRYEKNVITGSG